MWPRPGIGVVGILSIVIFMKDTYWYNRLTSFTDPFAGSAG